MKRRPFVDLTGAARATLEAVEFPGEAATAALAIWSALMVEPDPDVALELARDFAAQRPSISAQVTE